MSAYPVPACGIARQRPCPPRGDHEQQQPLECGTILGMESMKLSAVSGLRIATRMRSALLQHGRAAAAVRAASRRGFFVPFSHAGACAPACSQHQGITSSSGRSSRWASEHPAPRQHMHITRAVASAPAAPAAAAPEQEVRWWCALPSQDTQPWPFHNITP